MDSLHTRFEAKRSVNNDTKDQELMRRMHSADNQIQQFHKPDIPPQSAPSLIVLSSRYHFPLSSTCRLLCIC
jgi:hypothetical protein